MRAELFVVACLLASCPGALLAQSVTEGEVVAGLELTDALSVAIGVVESRGVSITRGEIQIVRMKGSWFFTIRFGEFTGDEALITVFDDGSVSWAPGI